MNDSNQTVAPDPDTAPPHTIDLARIDLPERIGRFRVERILGEGGFGRVYLARDDQLERPVAIKVPLAQRLSRPEDAEAYLSEARILARLDHANIVPVHDVGTTDDGLCYVVSKVIEGCDLAAKILQTRLTHAQSAELTATVAEALHHAHQKGLVHRDIKPGNILLDVLGKPFVADFGLALAEEDFGKGGGYAGTPAYMSPEQACGEGHRVDGRSDIFSLGVIFYELLVGRRPFHGDSVAELLDQIRTVEVRPLRQVDESVPKELERICLKATAKRASERYTTARDMADDLRHWLAANAGVAPVVPAPASIAVSHATLATASGPADTSAGLSFDGRPTTIVPKGLRSFDAHDADFFLELLPGSRDRDGLPDSLRFWKLRIQETDADNTFSVGLIYGPSGCGKSSLVKAGLLPRLSEDVLAVYVEATAEETEARLANGLRKRCPTLPADLGLKEAVAALRRGVGIPAGKKVLIVIDQFEQWLHAKKEEPNAELVQALRQCDGGRVQCIVMVRDDFWMAATRFMRELEIRLVEGENSAAADLFPVRHAEKVLAAFGRAFGTLPARSADFSREQKEFVNQAVAGLSQEGKVISVRLALFAEMMKNKAWTRQSLREVGGTEGVGVTFLEETFGAASAPPEHRFHQKAARAVLDALLPESGTDIKGHMRSHAELLAASGYANRPKDFDDLLRILDGEIRLITPTDPEGQGETEAATSPARPGQRYYQLTHDYLVPSLRDWLTRKRKETRGGRAALRLAELASAWAAREEGRHLPACWEWLNIRLLTRKRDWTPPQKKMMRRAGRHHAARGLVLAGLAAAVAIAAMVLLDRAVEQNRATHAAGLVRRLLDAETAQVPAIVAEMEEYRRWADPLLRQAREQERDGSRQKLHASLALLPVDDEQIEYLYRSLLDAGPASLVVIRDALAGHRGALTGRLWAGVERPEAGVERRRLRAAAALAAYDPDNPRWGAVAGPVAEDLVTVPAVHLAHWMEALQPVRNRLVPPLSAIFRDATRRETERSLATAILADYTGNRPRTLVDLLVDADERQFAVLYPKLEDDRAWAVKLLQGEIDTPVPADARADARETLAKRQANAAVALSRLGQSEKVWRLLEHSSDPRRRSYLIHRLGPMGADAKDLLERLEKEPDLTIRRALILSLGGFDENRWPADRRNSLLGDLRELYRGADDPGLRAAAEWLLRRWREDQWLGNVDEAWVKDKGRREKRLDRIGHDLATGGKARPQWFVTGEGHTMVALPGPVTFMMGSPRAEAGRFDNEQLHRKRIGRSFALASKPVTVAQFLRFRKDQPGILKQYSPTPDCPVHRTTWYDAAAYCNWLSEQEGIPVAQRCYETTPQGAVTKLKEKYLSLSGYRLPTEAEYEFACRAGAVTSRSYGESEELLRNYGWYLKNAAGRSHPPGRLRPNDFGLFDMHGNVWCWCQERRIPYPQDPGETVEEDREDVPEINATEYRILRGGSFFSDAVSVRSAGRSSNLPAAAETNVGFRPAKTIPSPAAE